MKIAYYNYSYDLFGIAIGSTIKAIELMRSLGKLGHDVSMNWRKKQPSETNANGSVLDQGPVKKFLAQYLHDPKQFISNFGYIPGDIRILRKEKPDLLISRLDMYSFSSIIAAKYLGIPVIIEADAPMVYEARTFHSKFKGIPGLAEFVERKNFDLSDAAFCVSNDARNHFINERNATDQLKMISNGVDTERFTPEIDVELKRSLGFTDEIVVGFAGSFHYWHGVDNLAKVIQLTLNENPNIRFLLMGQGGPMQKMLQEALAVDEYKNKVTFTGRIDHDKISPYLAILDIVLAPYPQLDFFYYSPVKVYEYMACGRPVIASRLGQISELITDGETGFLTTPGAINEIVDLVLNLSNDKNKRLEVGAEARKYIEQNHTWERKARELESLCYKVLHKKTSSHYI